MGICIFSKLFDMACCQTVPRYCEPYLLLSMQYNLVSVPHKIEIFSTFLDYTITCFIIYPQSPTWYHLKEKSEGNILVKKVFPLGHFMAAY